jgi:hypothetical protein
MRPPSRKLFKRKQDPNGPLIKCGMVPKPGHGEKYFERHRAFLDAWDRDFDADRAENKDRGNCGYL